METGTVDVRTRDTERHGKMRVDELARKLELEKPAPSSNFDKFYKNMWDADHYKDKPLPNKSKETVEEAKTEEVVVKE